MSGTAAPSQSLRSRLIGAWELVSFTAADVDDPSNIVHPMSESVQGIIMYTPDGYMSAQLQRPSSAQKPVKDQSAAPAKDLASRYDNDYNGYTGEFYLEEKPGQEPLLRHHMKLSSYADWLGNTQRRLVELSEEGGKEFLTVRPEGPMKLDGVTRNFAIKWRRLPKNLA